MRTYTRYDPETGAKVKVTADSYEYSAWLSRKPSKKRIQRAALVASPVATLGTIGAAAGKKAIERAGERAASSALRSGRSSLATAATAAAGSATAAGLAAAAVIGAAIYGMGRIAEAHDVALGERANGISRQFVQTQAAVMKNYRAGRWEDVPLDVRTKLVNGYKAAIAKVYSGIHTGVIAPSRQIPYGR